MKINGLFERIIDTLHSRRRRLCRVDGEELKTRQETLVASERRYAEWVNVLPDVVISVNSSDCIAYASN